MTTAPDVSMLVPTEAGRELLVDLDDRLSVTVWDGAGQPPAAAGQVRIWVPPFLSDAGQAGAYAQLPDLQVVQLLSAGAEHFVAGLPAGVLLCNARGAHSGPTAEWAVTAILASYRLFGRFLAAQREGRWDWAVNEELAGRRVLIIGAGDIAARLQQMLAGFDVSTTMVGRTARDGVPGVAELPALLPTADVVVLLVPMTEVTRSMVDAQFLARMRDGALLVNAARGAVVDTDALVAELVSGRLRAALDVTEPEPLPAGHPLWTAPGLLLTPHIAGSVPTSLERAYDVVRAQVRRFLAGEPLQNQVGDY